MHDDDHSYSLRRRRIGALVACAAVLVGMPVAFIVWGSEPEALYTVIGVVMVVGVALVGLAAVALRCPRCDHGFVREVFGGVDAEQKHMARSLAFLVRPLRCPECGLHEPE